MTDCINNQVSVVDWSDPCARAKALRDAYYERLAGGSSQRVRFRHGDNEQEVQTSAMLGNIEALRREMLKAEDECRALQGLAPLNRRFAIRGGSRRQ